MNDKCQKHENIIHKNEVTSFIKRTYICSNNSEIWLFHQKGYKKELEKKSLDGRF